jgi:hypothetical protein
MQQVVNGVNYLVSFSFLEQTAQVKVYSTFAGSMTVTSYTLNSQPQPIVQSKTPNNLILINNSSGYSSSPSNLNASVNNYKNNSGAFNSSVSDVYLISNPLILDNFFVGGYQ